MRESHLFYLRVPTTQPYYLENVTLVNELIDQIFAEQVVTRPMFSVTPRDIDFSQFKPRSHYDSDEFPQLKDYFRAMMWLGRIEIYLSKPQTLYPPTDEDVQRQVVDAFLISELFKISNSLNSILKDRRTSYF